MFNRNGHRHVFRRMKGKYGQNQLTITTNKDTRVQVRVEEPDTQGTITIEDVE